jgi:hypothetical protein
MRRLPTYLENLDLDPQRHGGYMVVFGTDAPEGFHTARELLLCNWDVVGVATDIRCPKMLCTCLL